MALIPGNPQPGPDDILSSLQAVESSARPYRWFILAGGVIVTFLLIFLFTGNGEETTYRTVKAKKGDLTVTVTATGTLEPVKEVTVGTEISGIVQEVLVDENDRVKKGQVLARLNTEKLEAEYSQAFASVNAAKAALVEATATLDEARENLKKLEELHRLSDGLTPSKQELSTARATMNRALAGEKSARAAIKEAEARLAVTEINLKRSVIRSPINGIVLQREVEPGQTVAASFSTPELFVIAESLTQLVLTAEVDEADIGRVRKGQEATFTVDAFPGRTFEARITRVLYAPTESSTTTSSESVVTYETTLRVNNSDLVLRPGMTATADIVVEQLTDVLLVPNAALRFTPPTEAPKQSLLASLMPGPPRRARSQKPKTGKKHIYTLKENQPVPVAVQTGSSDGTYTVISGSIKPGTEIIIEMTEAQ